MSRLIDADSLDSFFYSETSGTDEMIDDAVMKYPEMEIEFSDDCRALCKDIIEMCRNVIKTEPTACDMEQYNSGYAQGLERGIKQAFAMKENADGCKGCAFEQVESWQMPCDRCKRNCKDYWRSKVVK